MNAMVRNRRSETEERGKAMSRRLRHVLREHLAVLAVAAALLSLAFPVNAQQRSDFKLPDNVETKKVKVWSEGTRIAGEIFHPKGMTADDKLPTVVLCSGWGGTNRGNRPIGSKLAAAGYLTFTVDYRGWGESDSPMILMQDMPDLDGVQDNIVTVKVKMIREVVDPLAEAQDIRNAINYIVAEPGVDPERIGLWGTSYGGGLACWTAAHDDRVKCVAAQVPGMGVMGGLWYGLGMIRGTQQARGEPIDGKIEPIPQTIDAVPGLHGTPHSAKMTQYDVTKVAHLIDVPTLIIDAEHEELMNRLEHGKAVYDIIKQKGNVPTEYHVMKGITHYGIYREAYKESSDLILEWFDKHLKSPE